MQYSVPKTIPSAIFRAYDIRGVVGEQLSEDVVYAIGCAYARLLITSGAREAFIGRDGRLSSPAFHHAIQSALCDNGIDVIDLGLVTSPMLYFAVATGATNNGIMVTASHNPGYYNGLKMLLHGKNLTPQQIQQLHQDSCQIMEPTGTRNGVIRQQQDLKQQYCDAIIEDVQLSRKLNIVVDCGNGVAGIVVADLLKRLGCEVVELFCEVDGNFPHHDADPSQEKNLVTLQRCVLSQKADVGLAFDGDCDRLVVVTNKGEIIWPDRLMMIFAQQILRQWPHSKIIFDVKCSRLLQQVIHQYGGEAIMWKTGHSHIKAKLIETQAKLAGEMSGHLFFNDRWFGFDDGLYAAARLLEILSQSPLACSQLFEQFPNSVNTAEIMVPVTDDKKFEVMAEIIHKAKFLQAEINTIDGLRVEFNDGWGLVRPSNTSPALTLRFEAENHLVLNQIQQQFRQLLLSISPTLVF